MNEIVILGGGVAGLSAAYHARLSGKSAVIFEAQSYWGGLLDNFVIDGFRFDRAIHLSFTTNHYVRSLFDQTPYLTHTPNPFNYEKGIWLKHPVQNNLYPLDVQDKIQAIMSFINRPNLAAPKDYMDWLRHQYGDYIANRYPAAYTKKYWTVPPEMLSTKWIGNRMYRPSLEEVLEGAMSSQTDNTYYAKEMRYPVNGGYKAFIDPMAAGADIRFNKRAFRIHPKLKYVEFTDGTRAYYEQLVSSIPLPDIIPMIEGVPKEIADAAESLFATSVALVSVGFNKPKIVDALWFYIYDESILASRVYSPSQKSPNNAPKDCSSLQFEIYYSKYKPLPFSYSNVLAHVVQSLKTMKLATEDEILFTDVRVEPYANVVFHHGMTSRRDHVKQYLHSIGIIPIGRFGEWDYLWSDQSLLSGKRAIETWINTRG
ncbi:NAD(P)-binding protein [Paenibacillus sp. N4]|uniref:protoporphyrinogen/coproporphyrinogen oxidase n=1 Tax=Paenibacillus vietnamensis TaxID=2590547 RepID=UPI001CD0A13D|nr:NAD(P)-binding protein [Paenibacillus vietnamensis]MCA0754959.1 NAD(P)-binding protein [Paenibacillus vietnamensis]